MSSDKIMRENNKKWNLQSASLLLVCLLGVKAVGCPGAWRFSIDFLNVLVLLTLPEHNAVSSETKFISTP